MMHRVTVKIERHLGNLPIRRQSTTTEDKYQPELLLAVQASTPIEGLNKAIRLLTSERDALIEGMPIKIKGQIFDPGPEEEPEEDDEDED